MRLRGVDVESLAIAGELERLVRQDQRPEPWVDEIFGPTRSPELASRRARNRKRDLRMTAQRYLSHATGESPTNG